MPAKQKPASDGDTGLLEGIKNPAGLMENLASAFNPDATGTNGSGVKFCPRCNNRLFPGEKGLCGQCRETD